MKRNFVVGAVFAFAALMSVESVAQECDKGVTLYFESNQKKLPRADKKRLDSLKDALQTLNINYVEVAGHADQKGSDEYNMKLAGAREKMVMKQLLKGRFHKNTEIKEFNFGESKPRYTTGDEAIDGKNRRVEIYFASLENGKLMLRQPSGTVVGIDKSFFSTCGLCGSFASVSEIKNEAEAKSNNIALTTADGLEYTTAGMVRFHFECDKQKEACASSEIKIPAATGEEGMQLWEASGQGSSTKWTLRNEEVKYDAAAKAYVVNARICNDVWLNIGKEMPRANTLTVKLPQLTRERDAEVYVNQEDEAKPLTTTVTRDGFIARCMDCMEYVTLNDSGIADNGFVYYYDGELKPALVKTDKKNSYYELSLANYKPKVNYSDSVIIVKIPRKFANKVKMYLPQLDSSFTVRHYEKSETLFRLKKPSHEFALTLTPEKTKTYRIEEKKLNVKYNKRKNLYFAKLKKKDIEGAATM